MRPARPTRSATATTLRLGLSVLAAGALSALGFALWPSADGVPKRSAPETSVAAKSAAPSGMLLSGSPGRTSASEISSAASGALLSPAERWRNRMRDRAGERDLAGVLADLATYGDTGLMPDHKRWLWEVTGLLALNPELCGPLAQAALDPARTLTARALVADVLANVSHPQALAALRDLIDGAPDDAEGRARLYQSFVLVLQPDAESARWLAHATEGAEALPAAVALGAVAHRTSEAQVADGAVATLLKGVDAAKDPEDQAAWILGLGNARHPQAEAGLVNLAASESPAVRATVARSLAQAEGMAAGEALQALVADADPQVAEAALIALGRRGIDAGSADLLLGLLDAGRLDVSAQHLLLSALARPETSPEVVFTLAERLSVVATDARVRNRARDLWLRG